MAGGADGCGDEMPDAVEVLGCVSREVEGRP